MDVRAGSVRGVLAVLTVFILPLPLFASVRITEIMYNPEGSDTGREWVEIYNDTDEPVAISGWRFVEGSKRHLVKGNDGATLPPHTYGILADKPDIFRAEFSVNDVPVWDTVTALNNSGERIALVNEAGEEEFAMEYRSDEMGANGDGLTLQWYGGVWRPERPTPGTPPAETESDMPAAAAEHDDTSQQRMVSARQASPLSTESRAVSADEVTVSMSAPEKVFIGTAAAFEGVVRSGVPPQWVRNDRFSWSFGDGTRLSGGSSVRHTYRYPGRYAVVLRFRSGEYSGTARAYVQAVNPRIDIEAARLSPDGFVRLRNEGEYDIDIGGWKLRTDRRIFSVPPDTILPSRATVTLAADVTGLTSGEEVSLETAGGQRMSRAVSGAFSSTDVSLPRTEAVTERATHTVTQITSGTHRGIPSNTYLTAIASPRLVPRHTREVPRTDKQIGYVTTDVKQGDGIHDTGVTRHAGARKPMEESGVFWGILGVSAIALIGMYGVLIKRGRADEMSARYTLIEHSNED